MSLINVKCKFKFLGSGLVQKPQLRRNVFLFGVSAGCLTLASDVLRC